MTMTATTITIPQQPLKKIGSLSDGDIRHYEARCPQGCGTAIIAQWMRWDGYTEAMPSDYDAYCVWDDTSPDGSANGYPCRTLAEANEAARDLMGDHLATCDLPPMKPMAETHETDFDGIIVRYYDFACECGWKILGGYDSSIKDDGGSCPYRIWAEDCEGNEQQDTWLWDAETAAEMHRVAREWIIAHDCEADKPTEPEGEAMDAKALADCAECGKPIQAGNPYDICIGGCDDIRMDSRP